MIGYHTLKLAAIALGATALGAALAPLSSAPAPRAPAPEQSGKAYGFILRTLYYPVPDAGACPAKSLGAQEMFLASLSAEDRAHYGAPENARDLSRLMAERLGFKNEKLGGTAREEEIGEARLDDVRRRLGIAPGKGAVVSLGSRFAYDSCSDPEDFPQFKRGNQTYPGPISNGVNLDGKVGKNDFVGGKGEKGIDNGLLRATGCNLGVQDYGDPKRADTSLNSQTAPTVIEISGVDSLDNDDQVTVRVAAAAQSLEVGANGDALYWSSIDVDPDPRYSAQVAGRIVDGVLTTEPFAFTVRQKESVVEAYRSFVGSRLRITFNGDGSMQGELFGYQTLASLDYQFRHLSQVAADFSKTSCPAIIDAVHAFADGFRDRRTGKFTAISAAYRFNGVPAFLIRDRVAAADGAARRR